MDRTKEVIFWRRVHFFFWLSFFPFSIFMGLIHLDERVFQIVALVYAVLFTIALVKHAKVKCPRCGELFNRIKEKPKSYRDFLFEKCTSCGLEVK